MMFAIPSRPTMPRPIASLPLRNRVTTVPSASSWFSSNCTKNGGSPGSGILISRYSRMNARNRSGSKRTGGAAHICIVGSPSRWYR